MEQLAAYLERLGYTVEEQGKSARFLSIFYNGLPVGFIFPDFTVRLVEGGTEHGDLKEVTAFVKENRGLELVGGKEYLILNYRDNRITTYYAAGKGGAHFVTYIAGEDGKVSTTQFLHFEDAVQSFAGKTGLTLLTTAPKQKKRAGRRFRSWLLHRLLNDRRLEEMTS